MTKKNDSLAVAEDKTQALTVAPLQSLVDDVDIPSDKLIIPRLTLLQSNSDAVQEHGEAVGSYRNTVTGENYGETVEIIPLKPAFGAIYFVQGEGMKCRSHDGVTSIHGEKCAQCPFGVNYKTWNKDNAPKCQETIDVLSIETTSMQPAVLTFRSTSYKAGKIFVTNLRLNKSAQAYRFGARREKNDKGAFFVIEQKASVPLTQEQYDAAARWKESFKTVSYDVAGDDDTGETHG